MFSSVCLNQIQKFVESSLMCKKAPLVSSGLINQMAELKEEVLQIRREISVETQKLDILADKLAETTAILKVSFAPEKEISGVVPFPFTTEEELDEFENSLTPELIGFYTKKISKIIGSEPLSNRFKFVRAEDIIKNYNLDGSNGK
ncbi:uncharacterized protein LOC119559613 isoform X1 [Drosophila subpulchrella]|uniref:uncharacterized protein LOC119559613 isoform X1 n=1 Tax=Drosophila subpulchrella TaxID=1486046 RepID=UPI0018A17283|nr:uncharacterized protein LOC119559613 isoform X1 [Drosophila subpulchrella]